MQLIAQAKREADQGSGGGDKKPKKLADEGAAFPPPREVIIAPLGFQKCAKEG